MHTHTHTHTHTHARTNTRHILFIYTYWLFFRMSNYLGVFLTSVNFNTRSLDFWHVHMRYTVIIFHYIIRIIHGTEELTTHTNTHTHTHIHIHTHTHTYIHTHIHTHTNTRHILFIYTYWLFFRMSNYLGVFLTSVNFNTCSLDFWHVHMRYTVIIFHYIIRIIHGTEELTSISNHIGLFKELLM